jgi:hypothetical protein
MRDLDQATNPDPGAGLPELNPVVGAVDLEGTAFESSPFVSFTSEPNP